LRRKNYMPALSVLDVVNDCLATLGELPLNTVDEGHPMVPAALRTLKTASAREQAKSWWFNKELTDLVPDTSGYIYLPNDVLRVDPQATYLKYIQRGRRLYKPFETSALDKYKFDSRVRCWLIRELPFEDLPVPAQQVISYSAQLDFMKAYEADQNKVQQVVVSYRDSLMQLNAEHTRNVGVNLLNRAGVFGGRTDIGVVHLQDALNRF
jgi:hypothetical protein